MSMNSLQTPLNTLPSEAFSRAGADSPSAAESLSEAGIMVTAASMPAGPADDLVLEVRHVCGGYKSGGFFGRGVPIRK